VSRPRGRFANVNRAKARRPKSVGMNRTEQAYGRVLASKVEDGSIRRFLFEAWRLKLASNCYYLPDFLVFGTDDSVQIHEVKGTRGYLLDPVGRVKLKVAANLYPELVFFGCVLQLKRDGGGFKVEEIKLPAQFNEEAE